MIEIGSFVRSNQGRDKDNIYIVKEILVGCVQLVDGNGKTLDKPKTKNIKHIDDMNEVCEKIATKLKLNQKVFDAEIYSAIKKFKTK
jgi:hypothetical protein